MNVPGYDIIEKVAEGGMGTVWKAKQVSLDRVVAIKCLHSDLAQSAEEVKLFVLEARSAAQLKHSNIIQVYDVSEHNGQFFIVMEYIEGKTVADLIYDHGQIPWKQGLKIAVAVADALRDAWETKKIIHRDIKPANIMLDKDGNVKLADLGLARKVDAVALNRQLDTGNIEGTPNYMSPEQAQCSVELDCRTDMYSLGALIYHMITGIMPFAAYPPMEALRKHATDQLTNPRDIVPGIPLGVAQITQRLMMKVPSQRYTDWNEAIADLTKVIGGRVLLGKQPLSPAASTIMLPSAASSAHKKPVRKKQQSVETAGVPFLVQAPAWLILLFFWIILGYYRYQSAPLPTTHTPDKSSHYFIPEQTTEPSAVKTPAEPEDRLDLRHETKTQVPETVTDDKNVSEPPKDGDTAKAVEEPAAVPDDKTEEPGSVEPVKEDTPTGMAADTQNKDAEEIKRFKAGIIGYIMTRDFAMAKALVANELEYAHSDEFDEAVGKLDELMDDLVNMNNVIRDSFRSKTGQTVLIQNKGKPIRITIKSVSEDGINATMITTINGNEVQKGITFKISQLEPGEIMKWMGSGDTPAKNAMRYILFSQDGNFDSAKQIAPKCGPLSDIFTERLQ